MGELHIDSQIVICDLSSQLEKPFSARCGIIFFWYFPFQISLVFQFGLALWNLVYYLNQSWESGWIELKETKLDAYIWHGYLMLVQLLSM